MNVEFCGLELDHPIINGSGTFDALALRVQDDHPVAPRG